MRITPHRCSIPGFDGLGGDGGAARQSVGKEALLGNLGVLTDNEPESGPTRRVKIQRQMLDASKPINKAINRPTRNCTFAEAWRTRGLQ